MKIAEVELTKARLVLVVSIGFLAAALCVYAVIYMPLSRNLKAKYFECMACEGQALEARKAIESAVSISGERALSPEKDAGSAIDELTEQGKLTGVNFLSMRPKEKAVKETSPYTILPVEMRIEASYEQFLAFIGSLDELAKTIIKIKSFEVVPDQTNKAKLYVDLVVDMYFAKDEK